MNEPTPVPLNHELGELVSAQESYDAVKAAIKTQLRLRKGARTGTLSAEDFRLLPRAAQRMYAARFGRPLTADDRRRATADRARAKTRRKMAKASKRRNRA